MRASLVRATLLVVALFGGCGSSVGGAPFLSRPRWDLWNPIFVQVEEHYTTDGAPSFPKPDSYRQAFQRAVALVGGRVTQEPQEAGPQVLTLFDTDGGRCQGNATFAYTDQPQRRVAICHSIAVFNGGDYHGDDIFLLGLALHDLGHLLGNKGYHLGGDEVPRDACVNHYIMAWNQECHRGVTRIAADDWTYFCDNGGYTVNGVCA